MDSASFLLQATKTEGNCCLKSQKKKKKKSGTQLLTVLMLRRLAVVAHTKKTVNITAGWTSFIIPFCSQIVLTRVLFRSRSPLMSHSHWQVASSRNNQTELTTLIGLECHGPESALYVLPNIWEKNKIQDNNWLSRNVSLSIEKGNKTGGQDSSERPVNSWKKSD